MDRKAGGTKGDSDIWGSRQTAELDGHLDSSINNLKGQVEFFIKVFHQIENTFFYLPFLSSHLVPTYSGRQRYL